MTPSLTRNALARLTADAAVMLLSVVAGLISARWLGPAGKGTFSALLFLSGLVVQLSALGLGDAAVVLIRRRGVDAQEAFSASLAMILLSSLAGVALFWLVASFEFDLAASGVGASAIALSLGIPIAVFVQTMLHMINARERIVATSLLVLVNSVVTILGLWVFVVGLSLSIFGGVLAQLLGSLLMFVVTAIVLTRMGLAFVPRLARDYVRSAIRYGVVSQTATLLMLATARVDLLFVYRLAGEAAAGWYSVALTIGALTGSVALAVSYAAFPRLAGVSDDEASQLTAQLFRLSVLSALVLSAALVTIAPAAIRILFGTAYGPSVAPTLILLAGGVFASGQWVLARAMAARGNPSLLIKSFGGSLVAMSIMDLLLIPPLGVVGAAIASTSALAVGLIVCLVHYRRSEALVIPFSQLRPRGRDVRLLASTPARLMGRASLGSRVA